MFETVQVGHKLRKSTFKRREPKLPLATLHGIVSRPSAAVPAEHLDLARKRSVAQD